MAESRNHSTPKNDEEQATGEGMPPTPYPDINEPPPPYQPSYGAADILPPSYSQDRDPTDSPPSYDSLFGQVRAAKRESKGIVQFLNKVVVIALGTIGCTICVGLVLAVPISMIAMGAIYLYDCPAEPYIPIYLIVGGSVGLIKNFSNICQRVKNRQDERDEDNARTNPFDSLLNCFLCAWFIAGNVWIYRTYKKFDPINEESTNYCNPTLYSYAFWLTTAMYILMATVCCCICCGGLFAAVMGDSSGGE